MAGGKFAKPPLRGTLNNSIVINLMIAISLSAGAAIGVKTFLGDWRKKRYADFYKDYDPMKSFERMQTAGVLSSAPPPDDKEPKKEEKKNKK